MELEEQINEAQKKLPEWMKKAVNEAQREMFAGDNARLEKEEIQKINQIHQELKEAGEEGIWGGVEYQINRKGDEVVLDTFGAPLIPSDLSNISIDLEEDTRQRFNNALSEYGVRMGQKVEEQFEEWKEENL